MSISQSIKTNRFIRKLKKVSEYILRMRYVSSPFKIYFPYKSDFIHPAFDELKNKPPKKYSNKRNAKLLHLVMGGAKEDLEHDYILEIIDHPFSIMAFYEDFPREPIEYFNRQLKIKELYLSEKLKKIIFISNGQKDLFKFYFPEENILEKSVVIHIPWSDNISAGKRIKTKTEPINFLFIASNYQTKGVELVLKAWELFKCVDTSNATLTLVSYDIPEKISVRLHKSIRLIRQAPLSNELKNELYNQSDVVLALTLTDGITAIEATSYGKPIITYRAQHSKDFINYDNGIEIDVPINVYDVTKYGIEWETNKEFEKTIKNYIDSGKFDKTIKKLVVAFEKYSEDRVFLEKQTLNAINKYYKDYTIENRNKKLLEIYDECC
ncbi:MAG: glycosyltransferase family 4 protein [Thiomicrospira sp.]|nr:glycosyltransferase family 4 protein [Thiomicrospira sp.]